MKTTLPLYRNSVDWTAFDEEHPAPDLWAETVFKWPAERIRDLQNRRFMEIMKLGWSNRFYNRRWKAAGIEPRDIRSIEDIVKLPTFNSDDIKDDQREFPPYGSIAGIEIKEALKTNPLKIHTSGGTTGRPRPALAGAADWEVLALQVARSLYMQGARPGDVLQIPSTCSMAQFGWVFYKAAHDYLGILPVTTGSGVVTPSSKQIEFAFDLKTTIFASFPEYLTALAKTCRDEFKRDVRELGIKFLPTFLGPDTDGKLRRELEEMYGCPVYDNYGCNELSIPAAEGPDKDGLYILEDCTLLEILDVETNRPASVGDRGNIVGTSLYRRIPPIIRFNVRDLCRILPDRQSALGTSFRRMDHFLGRSDDMVKIRGTNVYPMACLNAVRSDPRTTGEWICVADRKNVGGVIQDELTVRVELKKTAAAIDGLKEHLENRLRTDLGVRVTVEFANEGALADQANLGREGKPKRLLDRRFKT